MLRNKKATIMLVFMLLLVLMIPCLTFADDPTDDVVNELKKKEQGPLSSVQKEVTRFSRDIFNIVRLVVVAVLVVSLFMNLAAFSKAGDNPGLRAALKTKMVWAGIGAILAINFWNIINLFSSIKILN